MSGPKPDLDVVIMKEINTSGQYGDGGPISVGKRGQARLPKKRRRRRLRGLGDVLAALFKAVGIKQKPGCGCKRRQEKLNKLTVRSLFAWLIRKLIGKLRRK